VNAVTWTKLGQNGESLDGDSLGGRRLVECFDEFDLGAHGQDDGCGPKRARSDLRTGNVDHYRQVGSKGAHATQTLNARRDIAVRHGETKDVDPCFGQF
jgi:hypothetical protein